MDYQGGNGQIDAFFVGNDGAVHIMFESNNGPWQGPFALTAPNTAAPGTRIATGHQNGLAQLDIFYVDRLGQVTVQWVDGMNPWSGPMVLRGPGSALVGSPLTTGIQGTNQLDLFWVDQNGAVQLMAVVGAGNWAGPWGLTGANFAPAGAPMATAPQDTAGQLDLFVVDNSGNLNIAWVGGGGGPWSGPVPLSHGGLAGARAHLAAAQQTSGETDVFYIDVNGQAQIQWIVDGSGWTGPVALSNFYLAPPGAPLAVTRQNANQLDLLVAGYDGLNVLWESNNSAWAQPVVVFPPWSHEAPLPAPTVRVTESSNTSAVKVTWAISDVRADSFYVERMVGSGSPILPPNTRRFTLPALPAGTNSPARVCARMVSQVACSDWVQPVSTQNDTWFDISKVELDATRSGFSNVNTVAWARAARAASAFCTNNGFVGGQLNGHEAMDANNVVSRVGVICNGTATATLFNSTLGDRAAYPFYFDDVDTTNWATASRNANALCNARGFAGGQYTGNESAPDGVMPIVCYQGTWFDVPKNAPYYATLSNSNLDYAAWGEAAVAANDWCVANGHYGGRMNGWQSPTTDGTVCY
jgi:hypothetical protein